MRPIMQGVRDNMPLAPGETETEHGWGNDDDEPESRKTVFFARTGNPSNPSAQKKWRCVSVRSTSG